MPANVPFEIRKLAHYVPTTCSNLSESMALSWEYGFLTNPIFFYECFSLPLQIGVALFLLYTQVKFAFVAGIAITISLIPGTSQYSNSYTAFGKSRSALVLFYFKRLYLLYKVKMMQNISDIY